MGITNSLQSLPPLNSSYLSHASYGCKSRTVAFLGNAWGLSLEEVEEVSGEKGGLDVSAKTADNPPPPKF